MDRELTIQQVAELTGLSAHTLRYYERAGLLDPVGRAESGHRRYAAADLAWLDFLTRLRATGMLIRQMQEFAALRRRGPVTARKRRLLLEAHQHAVRDHIRALTQNLARIEDKIDYYTTLEAEYDSSSGQDDADDTPTGARAGAGADAVRAGAH